MLSDNIKTLRKARGFSQEELAARVHVVRQTVSKWEKGLSVPDAELLQKLADALEVPVQQLLGAQIQTPEERDALAEQLSRINEQLVIRNRRSRRIWRTIGFALATLLGIELLLTVLGIGLFTVRPESGEQSAVVEEYQAQEAEENQ